MTSTAKARSWLPAITLAAFAVAFTATHLPPANVPTAVSVNDKLIHAVTYLILGLLCRLNLRQKPPTLTASDNIVCILTMVLYALFDEVTQPLVGRSFEFGDLLADVIGAMIGCTLACLLLSGARS